MDHEGITITFIVPATEPPAHRNYRLNGGRAPTAGKAGTIYHQGRAGANPKGPSGPELAKATYDWLRAHHPAVLESRLEKEFTKRGWKIIWTPSTALSSSRSSWFGESGSREWRGHITEHGL